MPIILPNGEWLFDDTNFQELVKDSPSPLGTFERGQHQEFSGLGSCPQVPLGKLPRIPRSEWSERIKEMTEKQELISDMITWICKSQGSTNFCWANGPCTAAEIVRVQMGLNYVELSAASLACKINGYVNQGGWGIDACKYLATIGACDVSLWPNTAISKSYDTKESQADRTNHILLGWVDIGRNFDDLMTYLLNRIPCPVGYDWWRHEVCAVDPVEISSGRYGIRIRNSWQNAKWGSENRHGVIGFGILDESKATPDDCQALYSVTPAEESNKTTSMQTAG